MPAVYNHIEAGLLELLELSRPWMVEQGIEAAAEYIDHGEYALAWDAIIFEINQHPAIDPSVRAKIADVAKLMHLGDVFGPDGIRYSGI